jgi:Putative phage serine protease XkdF
MDKVIYQMGFAKVDQERRIVSGFATLNNVDKQRDIVTTEASLKAFQSFRGNIRELHSKIAAGRLLDYGVTKFHDKVTNKVYDGIFVRAYVSKGAPDTWEKVLDGTLNGFSIGGEILDSETTFDEEGNAIRVIKDYELSELSLVDNPANPFANVVSIEKAHSFFSDFADTIEEKELNDMATLKKSDAAVEADVATDVVEEVVEAPVVEVVEEAVAEETVEEAVAEVVDEVDSPKEPVADETSSKSEENVEAVSEAGSDADVLAEAINEMKSLLEAKNTKTDEAFSLIIEQLKELRDGVSATKAEVADVQSELVSMKSTVSEFDKRVVAVEEDTAVRKSGDLGEIAQGKKTTEKSLWGGAFLTADL